MKSYKNFDLITVGIDNNDKWPFVTLKSFQRHASVARSMSKAVFVGFCHYVEEEDRSAWESYTGVDTSNHLIDSYNYFDSMGIPSVKVNDLISVDWMVPGKVLPIYDLLMNGTIIQDPGPGPYLVRLFPFQCVTLCCRKHLNIS
jgi:hypothetical protein